MSGYVLIVDDNADTRDIIARSLRKIGLECECAENGQQALAMIAARTPSLIISDLMMPKLNGFSMISELQRGPTTAAIPVILVSGVAAPQMERLPGVTKVILKGSLDLGELRAEVMRVMGPAGHEAAAGDSAPG